MDCWYGLLVLCFELSYIRKKHALCFVRWLVSAKALAKVENRPVTTDEARGPFASYYWSKCPGSAKWGHPAAGQPHYGVIGAESVLYAAPMIPTLATYLEKDPQFRLNTDMWDM